MLPEQPGVTRNFKMPKPVFYSTRYDGHAPYGTQPIFCEGGGRFDGDLGKPGWQEDCYWVDGYYGPRMEIIPEKVKQAMAPIPPGTGYCFNVEHWRSDPRLDSAADVEDTIRRFRKFFVTAQKARPDLRFSVYRIAPQREFWVPENFQTGMTAWEKYKAVGDAGLTSFDKWALHHVASKQDGEYRLDETRDTFKAYRAWQEANYRLCYGINNKGKTVTNWGLTDVLDYLAPSLYDFYVGDHPAYIKWNIAEARRISGGKNVYPFVMPTYHTGGGIKEGTNIPIPEWREHLRLILEQADGVIIWGANAKVHAEHVWVALDEAEKAVSKRKGDAAWVNAL